MHTLSSKCASIATTSLAVEYLKALERRLRRTILRTLLSEIILSSKNFFAISFWSSCLSEPASSSASFNKSAIHMGLRQGVTLSSSNLPSDKKSSRTSESNFTDRFILVTWFFFARSYLSPE